MLFRSPYPIDDVSLDFDLLDDPANVPDDGQMEVVIAAAPTEAVARQVEVLRLAGLEPSIVDLKSFAALRALRGNLLGEHLTKSTLTGSNYTESGEVALVMEIGASSSVINLVRGDRVLMARNINVSADDFTTALQKAFDLDFSAAEEVKLGYALAVNSHYGAAAQAWADTVAKGTNGAYTFKQFPSSALGGERELIEGLQLGTVEAAIV